MSQRQGLWAQLDWIDRLEVLGILLMLAYAALAAIDPILARSILYAVTDPVKTFFESLG